jgi:hypothetical protein
MKTVFTFQAGKKPKEVERQERYAQLLHPDRKNRSIRNLFMNTQFLFLIFNCNELTVKKVKLFLYQAVKARRVVRR